MKVLKQVGSRQRSLADAQDVLCAMQALPGFVFGYIDEKSMCCVTFHVCPEGQLQSGQQMVEATLGCGNNAVDANSGWPDLAPIGQAILASS